MAAEQLSNARLGLIDRVEEGLLKDLIDGLRATNPPVLTGREANEIRQAHKVTEDKTGQLVDMVCKKGDAASKSMIDILRVKDANIAQCVCLDQDQDVVDGRRNERMEITEPYYR